MCSRMLWVPVTDPDRIADGPVHDRVRPNTGAKPLGLSVESITRRRFHPRETGSPVLRPRPSARRPSVRSLRFHRYHASAIPFGWHFGRIALHDFLQRVAADELAKGTTGSRHAAHTNGELLE